MGKSVRQPASPVCCGIGVRERRLHPDTAVTYLDREGRYVIRPEVECASAFQVEARMMPMTVQDTVLDASPLERKAHVRATVIEGADAPVIVDDEDRTVVATHNEPPLCLQLRQASCPREVAVHRIHARTSQIRLFWVAVIA